MSLSGSKTTEKAIPDYLTEASENAVDKAQQIANMRYMANPNLRVAALTPQQEAAMNANIGAASSFGLIAPNSMTAGDGLPEAETVNGIKGYSSIGNFQHALDEARRLYPEEMAKYDALYNNPQQSAPVAQPQSVAPATTATPTNSVNWNTIKMEADLLKQAMKDPFDKTLGVPAWIKNLDKSSKPPSQF